PRWRSSSPSSPARRSTPTSSCRARPSTRRKPLRKRCPTASSDPTARCGRAELLDAPSRTAAASTDAATTVMDEPMSEPVPIVEMQDISIEFPGVKALDAVDFRLFPGEIHSLMGENGAGKSTLIKALTGVYQIDSGAITVAGKQQLFSGTSDAEKAG